MPRRCKICSLEQRKDIDAKLTRNVANSHIALEYNLTERQVGLHKKNHVSPFVADANAIAQQAVVDQVLSFRTEVNYPILTKILSMQDRLLAQLESTTELEDILAIIKEYRGWSIELSKVEGAYQQDRKNLSDIERAKQIEAELRDRGFAPEVIAQTLEGLVSDKVM